jgi:parallel beta-helix repeat protein
MADEPMNRTLRRRLTMIVTNSPARAKLNRGRVAAAALIALLASATARSNAADIPADAIAVKAGDSIQQVIDGAKPGATIVVAAGEFAEAISINKPITLIGAGWDKTIVGPTKTGALTQQQKDDFFKRLDATNDPEERTRIAMELAAVTQTPTLTITGAHDVVIRGLRFRGPEMKKLGNKLTPDTLVRIDNAAAAIDGVAVVGPFSNGVTIVNGSDVTIANSLVAGLWGTGVQVAGAKLHLADSDLRNCYSRCLTIAGEGSVIERNRISGSAWHGIRYDGCSPTITGNLIFGNARSGIYASGKTAAKVTGNIFWRNEMDGMSCWFANADQVEGNTFVDNLREGIAVLGGSTTLLKNNIFAGSPIAVMAGAIGGDKEQTIATPQIESNVFWNNPDALKIAADSKPLPTGNDTLDPKFVAAAKSDFTLSPDSPARQRGIGAADAVALAGAFAITPEELEIVPEGTTRDYAQWKK